VHAGDYHLLGDGCKHTLTGKGWVHKIKNVANHFPKPVAAAVKSDLNDIQHAETRVKACPHAIEFTGLGERAHAAQTLPHPV